MKRFIPFLLIILSLLVISQHYLWGQASLPLSRTSWDAGPPTGWTDNNDTNPAYTSIFACSGNNGGRLDNSGENYVVQFSSTPNQLTYTIKASATTTSSFLVEESSNGTTWLTVNNITTLP
ncbi:MAG: hypothetical protein KDD27_00655, partial [Saprospiraceae bacterium]|nr:hypothetical protein [Saprospiraceae bacterium]